MSVYTATELARFCQVDLKTIHNWVGKNAIRHHRTPGRHLRFHRLDVVDFLRAYGYPIPEDVRGARAKVALAHGDAADLAALRRVLSRRFDVVVWDDAFDALVSLAVTAPEALVLDVALLGEHAARCVARLRDNAATRHIRVLALGDDEAARASLMAAGAIAYVPNGEPTEAREILERAVGVG
jgi:excisionase family DNA binding protein